MTIRRGLVLIGLALLAGGLLLGFLPRSAGGVSCGSAFIGSDAAYAADLGAAYRADQTGTTIEVGGYQVRCVDTRSAARVPAIVLLIIGVGLLAGVIVPDVWRRSGVQQA